MPCTYEESSDEKAKRVSKRDAEIKAGIEAHYKKELDKLTRMLCGVLRAIETTPAGATMILPEEVEEWVKIHKAQDATNGEP